MCSSTIGIEAPSRKSVSLVIQITAPAKRKFLHCEPSVRLLFGKPRLQFQQEWVRRAAVRDHAKSAMPEGGKALRVYLSLRDDIANGAYPEAALLPGEQRLAESFGVSRVTVRRALDALAADGLIEKRAGAGSAVTARDEASPIRADFATLLPQLVEMGRRTTARLLAFSYGPAPAAVARAMGLAPGTRVQTAVRVRALEGRAFSHLTTHVPEDVARKYDEADLATTPLFQLLERGGVTVEDAHQSVTATLASPEVAEALDISVGSALLSLRRVVRDADGRGVEHLSALYRPDMFRLEMHLTRVGAGAARHWEPVIGAPDAGVDSGPDAGPDSGLGADAALEGRA
jgi:GntR family transcriptional regulator